MKINKDTSVIEFLESKRDFAKYGLKRTFRFNLGIDKKGLQDRQRIIEGFASTSHKDRDGDIISAEALTEAKNHLLEKGSRTVFLNHDRNKPIGKTLKAEVRSTGDGEFGLYVKDLISNASDVNDTWIKIKEGILNAFSVGGRFKKVQVERDGEGNVIGFKVLKIELFEHSVVGIPANAHASIDGVLEKAFKGFKDEGDVNMSKEEKEKKEKEEADIAKAVAEKKAAEDAKKSDEEKADEKPATMGEVKRMMASAMKPMHDGMTSMMDAMKKALEEIKEKSANKPVEKPKDEVEIPGWAKNLQVAMEELKGKIKEPTRKGLSEEDEDDSEGDVVPEKCLDPNDPKSIEYVKYVMEDEEIFNKLTEGEKTKAKNIYWKLLQKVGNKDR